MTGHRQSNRLRIIGGQWRSRRLPFPDAPGLRPTADRVRETLFNWLQASVPGASCLDLFAGSGACGLEALSRGASGVIFVERASVVADAIQANLALLEAEGGQVVCSDVLGWLRRGPAVAGARPADIVFVDPPYADRALLAPVCAALVDGNWLADDARIYLESDHPLSEADLPARWNLLRSRRAGKVYFSLCQNPSAVSV